jgi:hypothetical protein
MCKHLIPDYFINQQQKLSALNTITLTMGCNYMGDDKIVLSYSVNYPDLFHGTAFPQDVIPFEDYLEEH